MKHFNKIFLMLFFCMFFLNTLYAELDPRWSIGTLENDWSMSKLWKNHGFMAGSNVICLEDGSVAIYVNEDGSEDFEGNFLPTEGAGIIFSLDAYKTIVGTSYEVELEIPAAFPSFKDGSGIAQTLGIFEKVPKRNKPSNTKGTFVSYGYCPGTPPGANMKAEGKISVGGHHYSFGGIKADGTMENIIKPVPVHMGFLPLAVNLERQTVTIKIEIKEDSIEYSSNGQEPYYIIKTTPSGAGNQYEFRIMTHAAESIFGGYNPEGGPYFTIIKSVKINGEEILFSTE